MPSGTEFFDQWPRIRSLAALTWHTRKWERTPASGSAHPQVGAHTRKWERTPVSGSAHPQVGAHTRKWGRALSFRGLRPESECES
jgi:hypothetical protein